MNTTINDPTFGIMTCDKHGQWIGRILFSPLKKEIDVLLRLERGSIPNQEHRDFLISIEQNWIDIHDRLRSNLFDDIGGWADGTTTEQMFDSLEFEAFLFWDFATTQKIWEISATTPLDEHLFGIAMNDLQYVGFRMDG